MRAEVLHLPLIQTVWDHEDIDAAEAPEAYLARRYRGMLEQPPAFMAAPPQAMRLLLDWTRSRYGSVEGYVRELGVDAVGVRAIRDNMLTRG